MKRFYITGVSGVGKSSVAEKLQEKGIPTIDIDSVKGLCHWINKHTKEISHWHSGIGADFFESHQYVCDKEKLIDLMNQCRDLVVVVGLADNREVLDLFDKIFLFHCDEKIFLQRITERTNHDFGKHESEQQMILGWYKDFEQEMLDKGAVPINTAEPLDVVVDKVITNIKN